MEPFLVPGGQVGRDIKFWRDQSVELDLDREARKSYTYIKSLILPVIKEIVVRQDDISIGVSYQLYFSYANSSTDV